jgi:hypothetical protein
MIFHYIGVDMAGKYEPALYSILGAFRIWLLSDRITGAVSGGRNRARRYRAAMTIYPDSRLSGKAVN